MFLFSYAELLDLVIMVLGIGIIFLGFFGNRPKGKVKKGSVVYDPLKPKKRFSGFDMDEFKFAILATAPAVVLHEMAHKFVALGFGLDATFHAFIPGLVFGILLKLINPGFVVFIPGYVQISGGAASLNYALIAFAGPAIHLTFWIGSLLLLKHKKMNTKQTYFWTLQKKINMFLFFFNMIPIPPFDGFSVFSNIVRTVF